MTLRELLNQVLQNLPLNSYLENFKQLNYELRIINMNNDNKTIRYIQNIRIDNETKIIDLEVF